MLPQFVFAQSPTEVNRELTLSGFRSLLSIRPGEHPDAVLRRGDGIFFELLAAQGREAAARQSFDRLAGWTKAAQARLDAESAPLLDVEMLRFAEAAAEARFERFEAARLSSLSEANRLLGREPDSQLVALLTVARLSNDSVTAAAQSAGEFAARIARYDQLLSQAQDLLAKIYQNYLFGGVAVTALLYQEEQTYETELQYRLLLAQAERARTVSD